MIHWKREGEETKHGLSIYHPDQKHSFGGTLRIGDRVWRVRYSKIAKRWFIGTYKITYFPLGEKTKKQYGL